MCLIKNPSKKKKLSNIRLGVGVKHITRVLPAVQFLCKQSNRNCISASYIGLCAVHWPNTQCTGKQRLIVHAESTALCCSFNSLLLWGSDAMQKWSTFRERKKKLPHIIEPCEGPTSSVPCKRIPQLPTLRKHARDPSGAHRASAPPTLRSVFPHRLFANLRSKRRHSGRLSANVTGTPVSIEYTLRNINQ